ncbi:WD repeat-containing protein 81 isoform X1 [Scyliorhinus canicula]|uniref:WD repeat-containing protein 81 isoform X1 n=1 Tax=Scyliorhinus canicula TaxID=7830 RepID=UPI0018F6BB28|nr:WD repeat-containing protein 81 isoform X1 [Scyliorhinus canicula]XP_038670688.1 WD repeat-containing protein 81 isoform X1 [Scyliorhinus canicula]
MECRVSSVENDLGIDRKQLVFGEGAQIVAFVSLKWLSSLKERKVLLSCPKPEGVSEAEITTFLQPSVNKLPAGWTRVSIQTLRKSRLRQHQCPSSSSPTGWSGDAGRVDGELDLDSLSGFMKHVADQNYRNLWREAHGKYVRPHTARSEKTRTCCLESMKRSLSRLLGCSFIPVATDSSLSKDAEPSPFPAPHPNLLPAEALLESTHFLYVIQPFSRYSLQDVVTYSPAKLASSHAKVLFILFQVLHAMRACHREGLTCGSLSLNHLMVDERLWTQLQLSLSDYEGPECVELTGGKAGEGGCERAAPSRQQEKLSGLLTDWLHGGISNFSYLMGLNRLAGRRAGDPNYHPVLPWVVDFTVPYGKFRDLRKSKFRLNKGDKQLDFTYEMTKEAFVAGGQAGEQLHVPHHISDILSDITYYVYKARRTPRSVLCSHVRSQWEPNEYPASVERMQSWSPDECIPEFYTDPTIFQSIHPDMPDLDIPNWCGSYQEFIDIHRKLLESKEVSSNLHHWIDLTFGYKLTGKEAVKAKNVCLHLVDGHSHLTSYGVVQLFDQPHPQRLAGSRSAPPEAPIITHNLKKVAEQHAEIRSSGLINGMVPETAGSEGAWPEGQGSGDQFKEEDLEEGTEALDSLSAPDKPLGQLSPVGVSGLSTADPGVCVNRNRGAADQELRDSRISLPDGFNALQALEQLEKNNNFLVRGLYSQLPEGRPTNPTLHLSYSQFVQRDMQAFGILIGEISFAHRLRALGQNASLLDRFLAVRKLCLHHTKEIAAPLQHVTSLLLQLHRDCEELLKTRGHGDQVSLFDYAPVFEGLPPPSAAQLLTPCCPIIPFPFYFNSLHQFVCTYYSHWAENVEQGRDFVFSLWQQLDKLLEKMQPEGLEILLPFILGLMSNSLTAVYAAWYFFEPIACALGPRNAYRYLLKPLVGVYEKPGYLCGRFYLYTDCFIVQLIVRLGLQPFLNSLLPHILQVLTGQEGAEESRVLGVVADDEDGVSDSPDSYSSGDLKGAAEHRSSSFADFSSGISFSDQAEVPESEEFQNGIFLSEQESVSLGKLSNKSSNSDTSAEDRGTDSDSKERPSLHSADSNQDLKLTENALQLSELEDEEDEGAAFGPLPVSDPRETETLPKGESLEEEEEEEEEEEDLSEGKEQKILLDTACKTVRWLAAKLGPTLSSRYIVRNLLRLLVSCYFGPEKHQFVLLGDENETDVGNIYERRPVLGDLIAKPVLECLMHVAMLYGEAVLTYQCLTYIAYVVGPSNTWRLNSRKEAGLLTGVVLMQKIIVYLSDSTLMDVLPKINQEVLLPVLEVLTSPNTSFPSRAQARTVLCVKTLSLIVLVSLRIGQEMVTQHMSETLRRFFQGFSVLSGLKEQMGGSEDSRVGLAGLSDGDELGCDPAALEELEVVFNLEMAYSAYVPFNCLIGDSVIKKVLWNHDHVWKLVSLYQETVSAAGPESPHLLSPEPHQGKRFALCVRDTVGGDDRVTGTFGSVTVGNRIEIPQHATAWGHHLAKVKPCPNMLSFAGSQEESSLKQELPRSARMLCGNWLAYWQYEIGLSQHDTRFYFHQIRLQHFTGHLATVKCLSALSGEDFFLSASRDKTVRLWSLYNYGDGTREMEPRLTYSEHRKSVFYVHQAEALQQVVSCDGSVHIWDQFTGKPIRIFDAFDSRNPVTAVTSMPAPHYSVITGTADSVLHFIDPRKPGLQHEFKLNTSVTAGLIRCMAVSPSGRSVAVGFSSGYIYLLDTRTGLILRVWQAHDSDILQLKTAEGNVVVSSSTDHCLTIWKECEQKPFHHYRSPSDPVHIFDLHGNEIVAGTVANRIGIYSLLDTSVPVAMNKLSSENFRGTLTSLGVLPAKRLLLLGSDNGVIRLLA